MLTVLIVEDDADVAALLATLLESEGYGVRMAVNGAALPLARAERPALVLLDIQMPGMDGIEVAKHLRSDARTAEIPIVLMSAGHRLRERAGEVRVDGVLPKPFDLDAVLALVQDLGGSAPAA